MDALPAWQVAAGQFVLAQLNGARTLCLKAEREGKDHVNHFLIPLDPRPAPAQLALHYLDPEQPVQPTEGYGFALDTRPGGGEAAIGDALVLDDGEAWLKLRDAASSQRLFCYVALSSGRVRPRLERHRHILADWRIARI